MCTQQPGPFDEAALGCEGLNPGAARFLFYLIVLEGSSLQERLSLSSCIFVGSMLFGMFFGAGNLIFPVHMGQEAGSQLVPATIGFLITGIGLPFLGIVAMGVSGSNGLFDLASRVHPSYATFMTVLLYLTIGPAFALPRTATVSYQIGLAPYISDAWQTPALAGFTFLFFVVALLFSLRPSKILVWIGKLLNPLFLLFLAMLIFIAIMQPMGPVDTAAVQGAYQEHAFFKGFTEGYNTMDVLASLAFGIIVIRTLRDLGIRSAGGIVRGCLKAGFVSILLMGIIYSCLSYIGTTSLGSFALSANGGIALAQIASYYFGSLGALLLALIVTLACLKTAIGLITACSETFEDLFPGFCSYRRYAFIFTGVSFLVGNVGLTQIITLAVPILMFLYPLAITLVLLAFMTSLLHGRRGIYISTTIFTLLAAIGDALQAMPAGAKESGLVQGLLQCYVQLPFFDIGMGWIVPALAGFAIGCIWQAVRPAVQH